MLYGRGLRRVGQIRDVALNGLKVVFFYVRLLYGVIRDVALNDFSVVFSASASNQVSEQRTRVYRRFDSVSGS